MLDEKIKKLKENFDDLIRAIQKVHDDYEAMEKKYWNLYMGHQELKQTKENSYDVKWWSRV